MALRRGLLVLALAPVQALVLVQLSDLD